ncbi:MAG: hypothetical protein ACKO37_09155 [Vampirovibrionales bacterium]
MYKKLLALVNAFVYLRQGYFNRYYEGKILDVTPDTLTIQAYKEDGSPDAVWTLSLNTITEFMVGDRELDELKMRVCLAKTVHHEQQLQEDEMLTQSTTSVLDPEVAFLRGTTGRHTRVVTGEDDSSEGPDFQGPHSLLL